MESGKINTQLQTARRERIIALDLLRGFFMFGVIVDHTPWAPTLFSLLSGGGALFISPAEGFFVISGLLVGYLYGPKILTNTREIVKKLWKRAGMLYLLSIGFTLLYVTWALLLPEYKVPLPMWHKSIESFVVNLLTARYSYGWTDFLPRYAVFMLVSPLLLWVIAKGKWWIIGIISVAIWGVLGRVELFMPFAAWQMLFIGGMVIGYYLPAMKTFWNEKLSPLMRRNVQASVSIFSVTSFTFLIFGLLIVPYVNAKLGIQLTPALTAFLTNISGYFDKQTLGIGRVTLGILYFATLYLFIRQHEQAIERITKGALSVYGKNSLFVYGLHCFVLFGIWTIFAPFNNANVIVNTAITSGILALIYLITRYRHSITSGLRWLELQYRYEAPRIRSQDLTRQVEYSDS